MINYENLKKAKELLKTIPEDRFDMKHYTNKNSNTVSQVQNTCNSVCCVIGHCVVLDDYDNLIKYEDDIFNYHLWGKSFFGIKKGYLWDFLFSGNWFNTDNTVKGAIKRIDYVLNNKEFSEELNNSFYYLEDSHYKKWYKLYN